MKKALEKARLKLTLLSVDGTPIPAGTDDQTMYKEVIPGKEYPDRLSCFLAQELTKQTKMKEKRYQLSADMFFPVYRKDLVCKIPKDKVDKETQEGDIIQNEKKNTAYVLSTKAEEYIVADFNHPFSGKTLDFTVEKV